MVVITSFKEPESPIRLQLNDVEVILDKKSFGTGTLYISESELCWEKTDKSVGFNLNYHNITLHAISKDRNVCPRECIYVLTDPHVSMPGDSPENPPNNDDSEDESESNVSELILVPFDSSSIEEMYNAIKVCQELNPDPDDVDDEDDEDDDHLFADAEEMEAEDHARGDHVVDNLSQRIENSVNVEYSCSNGNGNAEDEFEDAD